MANTWVKMYLFTRKKNHKELPIHNHQNDKHEKDRECKTFQILINSRMGKLWYIHTIGCHAAMRMKNLQLHGMIWMNLTSMTLRERSQRQKKVYYSIHKKNENRQNYSMLLEIRIVVILRGGGVSGRRPEGGFWDADNDTGSAYTGVFSS